MTEELKIDCPIYMFHQTSGGAVESVLAMELFNGKQPIKVSDLTRALRGEITFEKPLFCLTLDDGYLIQHQQVVNVLERYKSPATFFAMSSGWKGDGVHQYMSQEQIRELHQMGFEIGSHTINHPLNLAWLKAANPGAYLAEIFTSKEQLEEVLRAPVSTFCYPNGVFDQSIMEDVAKAYKGAVSTIPGSSQSSGIIYRLNRIRIN